MEGIVILASCEYHFIRVHENRVQHPSNNISIIVGVLADDVGAECARDRDDHEPVGAGQEEVRHVLAQGGRHLLRTD